MNTKETSDLDVSQLTTTSPTPKPTQSRTQATLPGSRQARWPQELQSFDLGKYAGSKRFQPTDWAQQFAKRFFLRNALTSQAQDQRAQIEQWMPGLLADPLAPYPYTRVPASLMQATGATSSKPQLAVRALTTGDLRRLLARLPPDADSLSAVDEIFHQQGMVLGEDGKPVGNPLRDRFYIAVDLNTPTNVLVEQYKLRLQEARNRMGRPEVHKHQNSVASSALHNHYGEAETWRNFNVLPYVDIELTMLYHGIPMPSNNLLLSHLNPSKSASHLELVRKHVNCCLTLERIHELLLT